jgi:hypothetical protein
MAVRVTSLTRAELIDELRRQARIRRAAAALQDGRTFPARDKKQIALLLDYAAAMLEQG